MDHPHHHQKRYLCGMCPWHSARCFLEGLNLLTPLPVVSFFITTCQLHNYFYLLILHEMLKAGGGGGAGEEKDRSVNLDIIIKNGLFTQGFNGICPHGERIG